jgi:hypothetical protein
MYPISFRFEAIPRLPLFLLRPSLFGLEIAVFIEHVGYFICDRLSFKFIAIGDPYNFFIRIIGVADKNSRMNLECL